ncbi:hypothetical protein BCV69DRAFT_282063 [Microstroma glucosiphilum]|uniref:Uncharacterized protein n=1 Tax=Pseudomicrostroma glucosiphilum TaxID=1684307 RepID=A0A316U7Y2_9BASI|nr:hypothetical protein BCV69DRAFT_282063 [Pseudomicrostroma glucosiphilum]PWN21326.1 hypothetical protein BCV69DRAFT_282063 [Pseudomicrostroma glucosiphilum]
MLSGRSSPVLGQLNLHPHNSSAAKRRGNPGMSSAARRQSLTSSEAMLGADGELHDPGYHDSLRTLRAQIEAGSSANSSSSSLQRRATINSVKSRRSSLANSHVPNFLTESRNGSQGQVQGLADQDDSSSEEELDEDDSSILNEHRRKNSSSGISSPFLSSSTFATSSAFTSPHSAGTPRRRALTSSSASSNNQKDRKQSGSAASSLRKGSVGETEELVYEAPPLPASNVKRQGSSLRSSFSAVSISRDRSGSAQQPSSDRGVQDWQGGFTSLVDLQRTASREGGSSTEGEPARSHSIAEPAGPWRRPSHSSLRGSVESSNNLLSGDLRRSSGTKARSSSDGSTRGHGGKRVSDIAASTGVALRQNRSESDPTRSHVGSRERSRSEADSMSFFAAGYRPVAATAKSANGHGEGAEESHSSSARLWASSGQHHRGSFASNDPLARVEEREGSPDVPFAIQSAVATQRLQSAALGKVDDEATRQERIEREKSPRLPFLGRRPSPVAIVVDQPGISGVEEEPLRSNLLPLPWISSRGANGLLESSDEEISFNSVAAPSPFSTISIPRPGIGVKSPSSNSGRSDAVPLSEGVRRKMQRLGLGMRFKALQAEKRIKKTFSNGSEGKQEGSEV